MSNPLSPTEADDLARLEDIIARGLDTFLEVEDAIAQRDAATVNPPSQEIKE